MAITSALPTSLTQFVEQSTTRGLWGFILPTMGLMLLFKGVCCTLTIHTSEAATHKIYAPISYPIDIHQAPRLSAHLVYILYFKFSKKSKIKGAILTNCSLKLLVDWNLQNHAGAQYI